MRPRLVDRGLRRLPAVVVALMFAGWLHGCNGVREARGPTSAVTAAGVLATVGERHPELAVAGVMEYAGDRLYDYMNGAAVSYFEHDFTALAVCDARHGQVQAKVELFDMHTPDSAAAIFETFRVGNEATLEAGAAGVYWPGVEPEGMFHRERFFVRILAYATSPEAAGAAVRAVASAIDGVLQPSSGE